MSDKTGIEWTDATWNPVTGCSVISAGCKHCYAMKLAGTRLQHHQSRAGLTHDTKNGPVWTGEVRFNEQWLDQPRRWAKPRMVFVCAHADLFHEAVPDEWIDKVFAVMALASQHTFQVLTKRPERMRKYLTGDGLVQRIIHEAFKMDCEGGAWMNADHNIGGYSIMPLPNVWLGVSVEDQAAADERIPLLRDTPAAVRWISAEPLLGPVNVSRHMWPVHPRWPAKYSSPEEAKAAGAEVTYHRQGLVSAYSAFLDWVVVGGESGPNARPMHPDWARSLRDQCAAAGVPYLFKQWGEFRPDYDRDQEDPDWRRCSLVERECQPGRWINLEGGHGFHGERVHWVSKVGKKRAGRLLDGMTHDGYPGESK